MPAEADVVVVGAGPAGCAAAARIQQLDPDLRVIVLDRAQFPRDKPCGDGIAAEVGTALAGLGFDTDRVFAGFAAIGGLILRSPGGVTVDRPLPEPVHVVPRQVFDARLVADLGRRGIAVRQHRVRSVRIDDDGVTLDGVLRARVVIGADGAESVVRRTVEARRSRPHRRAAPVALAIRGYAPEPAGQAGSQLITMTADQWPAYAWSFPVGDGTANVGYGRLLDGVPLTRAEMLRRLHELLPGLAQVPRQLRAHRLPLSSGRPPIGDGRLLLVGDAQSLINPFTGEGIFYAVTSGALAGQAAAETVHGGDPGRRYRQLTRRRLGRHLRHSSALSRFGGHPSLIDAGLRAARDDQGAFDDLVRFGLADGLLTARTVRRLRFRDR